MRPRLLAWKIEGLLELFSEMGKWKKAGGGRSAFDFERIGPLEVSVDIIMW